MHDVPDIDTTALLEELAPTPDVVERMRSRMLASIAADAPATTATTGGRRRGPRHRRLAIAMAGAAVIALAVALSPFGQNSADGPSVLAPTTAKAALEQAADAAGSVPWSPLADGEYHHTMTTTFTPEIPTRKNDPQKKIDQMFSFAAPASEEAWLDSDGRGIALRAMGGNGDPNMYPVVQAGGFGSQPTFGRRFPERETVDVPSSLRLADMVAVEAWRRGSPRATSALWYRTPTGFERRTHQTQDGSRFPGGNFGAWLQIRSWKTTKAQVDLVNASSENELDAAIQRLLDDVPAGHGGFTVPPLGRYGVTKAEVAEEERVMRAVDLLGSAPLSPEVRRGLFSWLSQRSIAKLVGPATDELGRAGTEIVMERINDRIVPPVTVTIDQLRDEYGGPGGHRPAGAVRGPTAIHVKRDHQYRRWYLSLIFDEASGELLQHVTYARQETTAQRPRLQRNTIRGTGPQPPWRVAMAVDRQGMSDAVLYNIRERTTSVSGVQTAACRTTPRMCR